MNRIDCRITKNYLKEKYRMTDKCLICCEKCVLSSFLNGECLDCGKFEMIYPDKAIEKVQKWSDEHPIRTVLDVLLERFPDTRLRESGIPKFCPNHLGLTNNSCDGNCVACWNSPSE